MSIRKQTLSLGGTIFLIFWLTSFVIAGDYYYYGLENEKVWMERMDTRLYLELEEGKTLTDVEQDILTFNDDVVIDSTSLQEIDSRIDDDSFKRKNWIYVEGKNLDKADFTEIEGIIFKGWYFRFIKSGLESWLERGFNFQLKEDNGKEKLEDFVEKHNLDLIRLNMPDWYNLRLVENNLNSEHTLNLANKSFEEGYSSIASPSFRGVIILDIPIEIEEGFNELDEKFQIYPNPAKDFIKVTSHKNHSFSSFELYSLQAKKVREIEFHNSKEVKVPVGDLPEGQYILRVRLEDGSDFYKKKIMISR